MAAPGGVGYAGRTNIISASIDIRTADVPSDEFAVVDSGGFASMARFGALAGPAYPTRPRGSHKGVPLRVNALGTPVRSAFTAILAIPNSPVRV